jgi:hypothetical protein
MLATSKLDVVVAEVEELVDEIAMLFLLNELLIYFLFLKPIFGP